MKTSKFYSLEELKAEVESKKAMENFKNEETAKEQNAVVYENLASRIRQSRARKPYNAKCQKHGACHVETARIGIQRTKFKRWERNRDGVFTGGLVSALDLRKLDSMYALARKKFHDTPCTCEAN